ncbi:MAG TPA: hypothetical protein VNI57_15890 [Candidatus Saccharimonadales bacterium]|nr:hypothetical protein [Candidatus Saccharimonadales bacterium]
MDDSERRPHCKFITSFGGAAYCHDEPYLLGFCQFHFDAYQKGEINEEGLISDRLDDQSRRWAINFHGVQLPEDVKPYFS